MPRPAAEKVERDALEPEHFRGWIDWAKSRRIGMDFNPTYFAHPLAADGYTLAHPDRASGGSGSITGSPAGGSARRSARPWASPCITNVWIPDGSKEPPVDRKGPRDRLAESLDAVFAEPIDPQVQPRRRRGQAVRHRLGELRRRLARVLSAATPSRARSCCASTPATTIRPRSSPTRSPPCSCTWTRSCCTSAGASAGTATTS